MINISEIAASTEERVLENVKASQARMIEGLKGAKSLAGRVVPETVGGRIEEQVSTLPSATPMIDGYFSFAAKMLDAQREFMAEVVEILQPAPAKAPAKAPAAKKTAAKKPAAKKAAAKRTHKAA